MTFEAAQRLLEIGVSLAVLQRALEHLGSERLLFGLQAVCAVALLEGTLHTEAVVCLLGLSLWQLHCFQGPYNGGADKMSLLCVTCLALSHIAPNPLLQELSFGYLACQLVLSYFVSGWVKLCNPDWRGGKALADVFAFSAYPVAENLRLLAKRRELLRWASLAVIALEISFPIALFSQPTLVAALILAAMFHLANALLFGLNRFLWAWIGTYPVLFWLQDRLVL